MKLSQITDARNGEYFLVNCFGKITSRSMSFGGSYGATVFQFVGGRFVRQFGL